MANPTRKTLSAEPPASELQKQFDRRFRRAAMVSADWRRQAVEFYRTYNSDPWPAGVKEALREKGRPAVNFNYALSQINAILGQDIADRKEARFQPTGYDTHKQFAAECLTSALRSLYQKCSAQREETEAMQDQLVTGYGFTECFLDTKAFPVWPVVSAIDCREMYWDPDYQKNNLKDAKYLIRRKRWTLDEAIAKWPGKADILEKMARTKSSGSDPFPRRAEATGYRGGVGKVEDASLQEDGLDIFEYQFKKPVPWVVFKDPATGEREKLPRDAFKQVEKQRLGEQNDDGSKKYELVESAELQLEQVYRCFLAGQDAGGAQILQDPVPLEIEMFSIQCATGFRTKDEAGRVQHFGLMSLIYEPQLWIARVVSAAIEHIARSPKGGGGFINVEALVDPEHFKAHGAESGYWALLNSGFDPKASIFERSQPGFPQAYEKLFDLVEGVMPKLTTITDFFKGTSTTERANVLVTNLQGQTMMVLNPLLDPMNQLRVQNARAIAKLAQLHVAPDDFNRLVGDLEAEGVTYTLATDPQGNPLWEGPERKKQPIFLPGPDGQPLPDEQTGQPMPVTPFDVISSADVMEYDVQVDLGPASPSQKQAIWSNWQQTAFAQKLLELFPDLGRLIVPWLLKNQPGLSADAAVQIEREARQILEQSAEQGTMQGLQQVLQTLPPDALQMVIQQAAQIIQANQQQLQPGAPATPPAEPTQ